MTPGARRVAISALLAAVVLACATEPTPPRPAPRSGERGALRLPAVEPGVLPRHVLLVSVHGLVPDAYLAPERTSMPTLAALAAAGQAVEAVTPVFPPAPYPAHTTLITGRLAARHGVPADRMLGDHGVRIERYAHASRVRAATLWQLVTEAGLPVAALDWPATGGAAIAGLLPDVVPRRYGETWSRLLQDRATPWLFDLALRAGAEAPAAARSGPERDAVLVGVACALLESETPPALLLLRLSQTEPTLASFGAESTETRLAFARVDDEIARLVGCLERSRRLASSAVVVAGDHGTMPVHTAVRPNAALADAGLVTADKSGSVVGWSAIARSNGGSAFVYARGEEDALLARRALEQAARGTRAFRVLSAADMLQLGADPEAWFGLLAEPGYAFLDSPLAPLVSSSSLRAAGGYLPDRREMAAGLVAWGPGLRARVRIPVLAQVDVAPTLAQLLGLSLGPVDGRVVAGMLGTGGPGGVAPPASRTDGGA